MNSIFEIIFWICVLLILHTYVIFPITLKLIRKKRVVNPIFYESFDDFPTISVHIAVYNEQEVIEKKIQSILESDFPKQKLHIIVGSDASTDQTNEILKKLSENNDQISFFEFENRRGKAQTINHLFNHSQGEIMVITDANVMFSNNTLINLCKHFKNNQIGLVDSHIINTGISVHGISVQESTYISIETRIKNHESALWGCMMGPFGGCFAIRKMLFTKIPLNFLMDDFFLNMSVLQKGWKTINALDAIVYEDVSNLPQEEFRRKVRISTGNFQNLIKFKSLLAGFWFSKKIKHTHPFAMAYCFVSHKILRWVTPMFLILAFCANALLISNPIYLITSILLGLTIIISLFDILLKRFGIHIITLRFVTHYYSMNIALLAGFIKFLKGVKTNVWLPTKRNQTH